MGWSWYPHGNQQTRSKDFQFCHSFFFFSLTNIPYALPALPQNLLQINLPLRSKTWSVHKAKWANGTILSLSHVTPILKKKKSWNIKDGCTQEKQRLAPKQVQVQTPQMHLWWANKVFFPLWSSRLEGVILGKHLPSHVLEDVWHEGSKTPEVDEWWCLDMVVITSNLWGILINNNAGSAGCGGWPAATVSGSQAKTWSPRPA